MDLLASIHCLLSNPQLLLSFLFNAVIGTVAFITAIHCQYNRTNFGYIKKYLLVFLAVNFIVRCFVILLCPGDLAAGAVLNGIAIASAFLLLIGAALNVLSKHVSDRVVSRYREK